MTSYIYEDHLETERLITRKLILEDDKAWSTFFEDQECVKYLPDYHIEDNLARAKHWVERQINRYENKLFGLQMLTDKQNKEFVGMCGLITQDVDGIKEIEIGYHLFKKHWGKGYASEAAKLFREYAFKNNLSPSVISIIHVDNIRSQKVAVANGMIREKRHTWNNIDAYIYRITNNDTPL